MSVTYSETVLAALVAFARDRPTLKSDGFTPFYDSNEEVKGLRSSKVWKLGEAIKQCAGRLKTEPCTDPKDVAKSLFRVVFVEPVLGGDGKAPAAVADDSSSKATVVSEPNVSEVVAVVDLPNAVTDVSAVKVESNSVGDGSPAPASGTQVEDKIGGGGGKTDAVADDSSSIATVASETEVPKVVADPSTTTQANKAEGKGKGSSAPSSGAKAKSNVGGGGQASTEIKPCKFFQKDGSCKFGDTCRFSHVAVCQKSATASSSKKDEYEGLVKKSQNFLAFMTFYFGNKNIEYDYSSKPKFEKEEDQFNAFSEEEKKYLAYCFRMIAYPASGQIDFIKFGVPSEIYDTCKAYELFHEWSDNDDEDRGAKVLKREALKETKINITLEQACKIEEFAHDNSEFFYWPNINGDSDDEEADDEDL
jgi:hypothetical protein